MSGSPFDPARFGPQAQLAAGLRIGPGGLEERLVDPATGLPVETTRQAVATRKASAEAFACWRLESMALLVLCGVRSAASLLVVSHAIRARTLGHGPIWLTHAFMRQQGISDRTLRTLLRELEGLQAELGWVRLRRATGKAAELEVTDLGLQQMAPARNKAARP